MPHSTATMDQHAAVAKMIQQMMEAPKRPVDVSYTLGWDVVASYSEKHINQLLADRHSKENTEMLKDLAIDVQNRDPRTKKTYNVHYRLKFGPPLLQFDANATGEPMCSISMKIISGTEQQGDDADIEPMESGWMMKLNNIPLATARGEMSENGAIDGHPNIVRGDQAVQFDYANRGQQHVVLGFHMDKEKLVVTAVPPEGAPVTDNTAYDRTDLQDNFKKFFCGTESRALSYTIASLNDDSKDQSSMLKPTKFQFATCVGKGFDAEKVGMLSIFIEVQGGNRAGVTENLQTLWGAQWTNIDSQPIPMGFTASLILSSSLVKEVLLRQGFKQSNWIVTDVSEPEKAGNKINATSSEYFVIPEQNIKYDMTSNFHIDGFNISLQDSPMQLEIRQDDPTQAPNASVYWKIETTVNYDASGKALGVLGEVSWNTGQLKLLYRLCDTKDFDKPRNMNCNVKLNDEAFSLDLELKPENFRMDQSEGNTIKYDVWKKGMENLWNKAPKVSISSVGLGFLRTTNLLTPGREVIDINEEIGLKAPKDFVLVGDVVKA